MTKLFTPLPVGRMQLSNRLALPPMTRFRADSAHTPLPIVKEYYAQRASEPGTLLITEGTFIAPQAGGLPHIPGIWSDAQIAAWKEVTDAVHAKGSYIYMQLWALGRAANSEQLKAEGGYEVVSASATKLDDEHSTARALTEPEIAEYIALYAQAARNAVAAGFDGVEIHAANGYLIDQFSQDMTNSRTDRWGGSVENRARFAIEVTRAVSGAIGADRTGIRFSPWSTFQGMRMAEPEAQFSYLAREMAELKLAFVHLVESRIMGSGDAEEDTSDTETLDFFLRAYAAASPVVITGGYQPDSARKAVDEKYKDYQVVIGIGRPWIANPDLPFRVKNGVPLVPYDREFFYLPMEPRGYVDYEFSKEFQAAAVAAAAA